MQRNSEVLNGLVVGHKRDGRCRYDPQVKQELVRQCMMPGVSVARMAMHLGGYSRVTDFFREWRATEGKKPHAFVPLKFDLGEAFQFGWSKEDLVVGGIYRLMQVSHRKLCASRAFAALGGVAGRGIYDNMKTAVDKVKKSKGRVVNARFAVMCAHYLFDADFCNVASGWEKGVVAKNVQDSRRRIWIEAQTRQWHSFDQLNAWLVERCRVLWGEIRHPEYKHFNVLEMLEQERTEMMPMPQYSIGADRLASFAVL
jgi:hypothetical protein